VYTYKQGYSMERISFKKFSAFIDSDGEVSNEQITEIFGLFKNNSKIEKLKAEREKLKGQKASKGAALDQALKDMAAGKKPGVMSDADLEKSLNSRDRSALAKGDKMSDYEATVISRKLKMSEDVNSNDVYKVLEQLADKHLVSLIKKYGIFNTEQLADQLFMESRNSEREVLTKHIDYAGVCAWIEEHQDKYN
jgi:hypothetical protein